MSSSIINNAGIKTQKMSLTFPVAGSTKSRIKINSIKFTEIKMPDEFMARAYSGMTLIEKELVIFGGGNQEILGDLWKYNVREKQFIFCGDFSGSEEREGVDRQGHGMVTIGKEIFLFGGGNADEYFNDLWIYDVEKNQFGGVGDTVPKELAGRSGHQIAAISDDIYILGGWNGAPLKDFWMFNAQTLKFTNLSHLVPKNFAARTNHRMIPIGNNELLIFGGSDGKGSYFKDLWLFDTQKKKFTDLSHIVPKELSARFSHGMVCLKNGLVVILGGSTQDESTQEKDMWIFDRKAKQFINISDKVDKKFKGRWEHQMRVVDNEIYILSGWGVAHPPYSPDGWPGGYIHDMWKIEIK